MKDYTGIFVDIFETAARADKYLPGIKYPSAPGMYSILEIVHNQNEHGFYVKGKMKLRATGRMLTCWELCIDLLLLVCLQDRQLIWSRANKYSYNEIGKQLGLERRKVKTYYLAALTNLEKSLKLNKELLANVDKIS